MTPDDDLAAHRARLDRDLDDAREPHCPECGTVLHMVAGGYNCRGCKLHFLPTVDDPAARPVDESSAASEEQTRVADAIAAIAARREMAATGQAPIPWAVVKTELDTAEEHDQPERRGPADRGKDHP